MAVFSAPGQTSAAQPALLKLMKITMHAASFATHQVPCAACALVRSRQRHHVAEVRALADPRAGSGRVRFPARVGRPGFEHRNCWSGVLRELVAHIRAIAHEL
jgi:hypothetical protein